MERCQRADCAAVELRADDGTRFVLSRLRAGVLLLRISGDDRGALGRAPFDELDREVTRDLPAELFIDLRDAAGASSEVREAWTDWFQRRRGALKRVSILASSRFVNLTVEVAKLFSRTGELIQIYSDPSLFAHAASSATGHPIALLPATASSPPARLAPPLPAVARELRSDGSVRLSSSGCAWTFARLRPGVLLVTVAGHDQGEFGQRTLDEVEAAMDSLPLSLFIDARRSSSASVAASQPWTDWLAAHRHGLERALVLTSGRTLRLTLAIACHRAGALIQIVDDEARFEAAIAARVAGFRLAP
jgi:hypothetical protein